MSSRHVTPDNSAHVEGGADGQKEPRHARGRGRLGDASAKTARRTSKRGDDVRRRILDAALDVFAAHGFMGASTRAVAERAGVTHTLILYHFRNKEELWLSTIENALASYTDVIFHELAPSSDRPASETLRIFIEKFVRMSAERPQIHRILTMETNQDTERMKWLIERYIRQHFVVVRDLIRRGQAEESVRECDPARLYYHIIGAGGTPFTIPTEYKELTGRDIFSESEIYKTIAFIFDIVFV